MKSKNLQRFLQRLPNNATPETRDPGQPTADNVDPETPCLQTGSFPRQFLVQFSSSFTSSPHFQVQHQTRTPSPKPRQSLIFSGGSSNNSKRKREQRCARNGSKNQKDAGRPNAAYIYRLGESRGANQQSLVLTNSLSTNHNTLFAFEPVMYSQYTKSSNNNNSYAKNK